MRRLVCACVVRKPPKTGFLASRPNDGKDILNHELSKSFFFCLDDCDYDDDVCTENNYNTVVDLFLNHFYEVHTSLVSQLMTTIPFCVNHRIKSLI